MNQINAEVVHTGMSFYESAFVLFFLVTFTLYWLLPNRNARNFVLLVASGTFYATWSRELAFLVICTTVVDYLLMRWLERESRNSRRKSILILSLVMNLGILVYFKYTNFFLGSLQELCLNLGMPSFFVTLKIAAPLGISFYTFEAVSYAVDVYHRRIQAEKNLISFMLFILFFPHLLCGPIVRPGDFLTQTRRHKKWDWLRMETGVQYFLMGLFKKLVIAERMAMYCDPVFLHPEYYSASAIWLAVLCFSLRIYFDFSGYSDMAVGLAHMFGYKLIQNFNMPYLSLNVSEFWRRWHISLSSWLRDYLFIPLGGSRCESWKITRNLMITMVLGGLWHGANWTFLIWGGLHGSYLVIHRYFRDWCKNRPMLSAWLQSYAGIVVRWALTSSSVLIAWVFFQPNINVSLSIIKQMFSFSPGISLPFPTQCLWMLMILIAICHYAGIYRLWQRWQYRVPAPCMGCAYAFTFCLILLLTPEFTKTFMYFNF